MASTNPSLRGCRGQVAFDTIAMLLGLAFGFAMVGSNLRGMLPHEYLFLQRKYQTARLLFVYSSICAGGGEQNPESHKDTRENTRDAISNKLFHKVLLRICVSVRDLTKSQPYLLQKRQNSVIFLLGRKNSLRL